MQVFGNTATDTSRSQRERSDCNWTELYWILIKRDTRVPGGGELHSKRVHHIDRQLIMDKRCAGSNRPTHSSDSGSRSCPCRCCRVPGTLMYTNKQTDQTRSIQTNRSTKQAEQSNQTNRSTKQAEQSNKTKPNKAISQPAKQTNQTKPTNQRKNQTRRINQPTK